MLGLSGFTEDGGGGLQGQHGMLVFYERLNALLAPRSRGFDLGGHCHWMQDETNDCCKRLWDFRGFVAEAWAHFETASTCSGSIRSTFRRAPRV